MRRLHLANIILICALGTLLLWPNIQPSDVYEGLEGPYNSVCMVSNEEGAASGVLLESGYIITAAHVIDHDYNGVIDDKEKRVKLEFPNIGFKTEATVIKLSFPPKDGIDIAILDPDITIPLRGSKIMSMEDYRALRIGTPIVTIGMQLGQMPANITDGRLIALDPSELIHRNSANSYFGNSGGGMFVGNELAGVVVAIAYDELYTSIPIFEDKKVVGLADVGYKIPLANMSMHVSAPAIIDYLLSEHMPSVLAILPVECPYHAYFAVLAFNTVLVLWLILAYQLIRRYME